MRGVGLGLVAAAADGHEGLLRRDLVQEVLRRRARRVKARPAPHHITPSSALGRACVGVCVCCSGAMPRDRNRRRQSVWWGQGPREVELPVELVVLEDKRVAARDLRQVLPELPRHKRRAVRQHLPATTPTHPSSAPNNIASLCVHVRRGIHPVCRQRAAARVAHADLLLGEAKVLLRRPHAASAVPDTRSQHTQATGRLGAALTLYHLNILGSTTCKTPQPRALSPVRRTSLLPVPG